MIITIDGPAGSGKSTVSKEVAAKLGFEHLDTGAMYRALTWEALKSQVDIADENALSKLAEASTISFERDLSGALRIFIDGADVTEAIRAPEINAVVSDVSKVPGVRIALVKKQRRIGEGKNIIVEGRDAGTAIFPDADLKIYLTASVQVRAERRYDELLAKGFDVKLEDIEKDILSRDTTDSTRLASPLVQAADARSIETTSKSVDDVVKEIVGMAKELI